MTTTCALVDGTTSGGDCDDASPAIHPGALELCDGIDDDCDGTADDGLATTPWFADGDADGFGKSASTEACVQPAATVRNDLDCDDTRESVAPGSTEVALDGVDQDCDAYDTLVHQDFEAGDDGATLADGFVVTRGDAVFTSLRAASGSQALGFADAPASLACLSFTRSYGAFVVDAKLWHPGDAVADTEATLLFRPSTTTVEAVGGGVLDPSASDAGAYAFEDGITGDQHADRLVDDLALPGWHALTLTIDNSAAGLCVDGDCDMLALTLHDAADQRVFCISVRGTGAEEVVLDDLVVRGR
jgi:hypothetical protein